MGLKVLRRWLIAWALITSLAGCDAFTSEAERLDRAAANLAAGDLRAAAIDLRRVLQDDPDNAEAHRRLAEVLYRSGDLLTAERELDAAVRGGAPFGELGYEIELALGRHAAVLERIAADDSLDLFAKTMLEARARIGLGEHAAAEALLRAADASYPGRSEPRIGIANVLAARGELPDALATLDAVIEEHPEDARARLVRGRYGLLAGRHVQAAADFSAVLAAVGRYEQTRVVALAGLAEASLASGRVDDARAAVADLAELAPNALPTLMLQGRIAALDDDLVEASALLRRAIRMQPQHIAARYLLATVLLRQGAQYLAEEQAEEILRIAPANLAARKLLATIRLQAGRPAEASAALAPLLAGDAADPELAGLVAAAMLRGERFREAADLYARALRGDPANLALQQGLLLAAAAMDDRAHALELLGALPEEARGYLRERFEILAGIAEGDADAARDVVEGLLTEHPDDAEALNLAAAFDLAVGDVAAAEPLLTRAEALAPDDPLVLLNVARAAAAKKDEAGADAALRKVLELEPGHPGAIAALVGLALRSGDLAQAQSWLRAGRPGDARLNAARFQVARALIERADVDPGEALLEEAITTAPNDANLIVSASLLLIEAGYAERALQLTERLKGRLPENVGTDLGEAYARLALGQTQLARGALERVLQRDSGSGPALAAFALLEDSVGNVDEALRYAARLRDAHPESAAPAALTGDILSKHGRYEEALAAYEAALRAAPSASLVLRAYNASRSAGQPHPERHLEEWLADNADSTEVRFALAQAYVTGEDWADAARQFELVAAARPDDAVVLNNLAWVYHELGDDRALATAQRAYALQPNVPAIADTLGWLLLESGDAPRAVALLRSAAAGAPDNFDVQYHLAMALGRNNQKEEARALLGRLIEASGKEEVRVRAETALREL